MDDQLKAILDEMKAMRAETVTKADLTQALYDLETKIIGEFWKWARVVEIKLRVLPLYDERLAAMETRLFSVEEKVSNLEHPPRQ